MILEPIIKFENFTFQYHSQSEPTLHQIDLEIFPGQKVLIVGPSGSGKSTLGHCLNGLIPFSYLGKISGSLKIKGQETQDATIFDLAKTVGTVLQDSDGQFVGLSVGEDIAFALENDCVNHEAMHQRVQAVAKMVEMEGLLGHSPFELSGGQKQRTALGGVLVDDVDVLLFDEPLANLDPLTGKIAIDIIDGIHKKDSKTIVIVEHRLEDVLFRHVDRIILMSEGRIVADMNPHELLCTDLLVQYGIREPLYVTALKYAGVALTPGMMPAYLETLDLDANLGQAKRDILKWHHTQVPKQPHAPRDPLIQMEKVRFAYDRRRQVIEDVTLNLGAGEMVAIVGKNGAGKSTLLKLLAGFERIDSGNMMMAGQSLLPLSISERAQRIGVVLQNPNHMISKTMIFDEVALGLRLRKVSEAEIDERVTEILEICGLLPFKAWPISALSYGQRKRVTIASILVLKPQVLILDEPTAGQDYHHYTEIMTFLKQLNQMGITIVLITHDMHLMLEYTTRTLVIDGGKVLADERPAVILTTADYIEKAHLKETSLFELARLSGIETHGEQVAFVQNFIDHEGHVL